MTPQDAAPVVGILVAGKSDWAVMHRAAEVLDVFKVPYEARVISPHRTPDALREYAESAEARGLRVLIAGAGGAAHLPGMLAAKTVLPVFGVPLPGKALSGLDALLSMVQMPSGIPVGTLAVGEAGARNAAYLAVAILGLQDRQLLKKLRDLRATEAARVAAERVP